MKNLYGTHRKIACLLVLLVMQSVFAYQALAQPSVNKVTILSTSFVLDRKFVLMAQAARGAGIEVVWKQVDISTGAYTARDHRCASFR